MDTYIKEALEQDFIRLSLSPATGKFFFVKKDGSLGACIDYRGMN